MCIFVLIFLFSLILREREREREREVGGKGKQNLCEDKNNLSIYLHTHVELGMI